MKIRIFLTWCMLIMICLGGGSAFGQNFDALLEAVDQIDSNLKKLVEQEKQQRTKDIARLDETIQKMTGSSQLGEQADLSGIKTQIDELKQSIRQLKLAVEHTRSDNQAMIDVVNEISVIRAEMANLENKLETNPPQLVSTDPASIGLALNHNNSHEEAEAVYGGIEWSGFFDVTSGFQPSSDDKTEFGLGQVEVDLASQLAENINIETAIAYNTDDGIFEVGAAFVDIHFSKSKRSHLRSSFRIDHTYIVAGQFDVPFGIDYHEYASIDNKLVTSPSVVHYTHDGWNDYGVQFGLDASHGNLVVYIVNGFESSMEVIDDVQALSLGVNIGDEIDTSPANALGGRLGIAPVEWLEIGTSFATGWNADGKGEMSLIGADLQFEMSNFELKGEYISHSVNRSIAKETNSGYYAQATYHILDRAFVTTRYGSFKPEGHEWHGQASIGGGYSVVEGLSLRVETVLNENSNNNQTIFQMVAGF